jgi:cytochrome c oxidase subunit II
MSFTCTKATLLLLASSEAPAQSMVHPAGPDAAEIALLWWVMLGAFTGVFILVIVLLLKAIFRSSGQPVTSPVSSPRDFGTMPPWGRTGFIVAGGVILPIVVLTPLYVYSLTVSSKLRAPREAHTVSVKPRTPSEALTVRVVGHMWWWEVRYPDRGIVSANEIYIPVGKRVRLELASADVIHSFWVPRLNGKRDLIPGVENTFWIQADAPGVYRGQCAEYCGTQHANMAFEVIALPAEEFDAWLVARSTISSEPKTLITKRGQQVFLSAGCVQCHAIEGTRAAGNVGPDLTHLGIRRMIGGVMLPNTRGNLAGWIADPQAIKPGIKMPRTYLEADDMDALVTYLESLK